MRKLLAGRFAIIIFAILVLILCALCGYAVMKDHSSHGKLSDNTIFDVSVLQTNGPKVTHINASSLTPDEAKEEVAKVIAQDKQDIIITLTNPHDAEQTWSYDLSDSISYNADRSVDDAYNEQLTSTFIDRFGYNILGHVLPERHYQINYTITPNENALKDFVKELCNTTSTPAQDAQYHFSDGSVTVTPAKAGAIMNLEKSYEEIEALIKRMQDGESISSTSLPISFDEVAPEITEDNIGYAIAVSKASLKLTLYKNGKAVKTYPVGLGSKRFPSPSGVFRIINKRTNPDWHNPMPEINHLPEYIPAGPNSPMGKRAMGISSPQIFIHGVPNRSRIGVYMSSGCINMYNEDVIELYDLVDVGCPVYIY